MYLTPAFARYLLNLIAGMPNDSTKLVDSVSIVFGWFSTSCAVACSWLFSFLFFRHVSYFFYHPVKLFSSCGVFLRIFILFLHSVPEQSVSSLIQVHFDSFYFHSAMSWRILLFPDSLRRSVFSGLYQFFPSVCML